VAPLSTICAIHTGRGLRYGIYFRRFPKNYRPSECTIVSHLCPPRGNPCLIGTIDAITLQIITILGPLRGLAALLHTPKRLAAGLDATAVRGRVQLVCHSLRDCIILLCCVKATLTTVQGAYILQSLDLKIARRENVAAFAQGMCTFSLHCMVAGSRRPCNASRSFYEMKPSSVDFQKGTV
jgi:hypothetical protein